LWSVTTDPHDILGLHVFYETAALCGAAVVVL